MGGVRAADWVSVGVMGWGLGEGGREGQGFALNPPGAEPLDLISLKDGNSLRVGFYIFIYFHIFKVQGLGPWWVQGKALAFVG